MSVGATDDILVLPVKQSPPEGKKPNSGRPLPMQALVPPLGGGGLEGKALALRIDAEVIHRAHSFKRRGVEGLKAAIAGGRACAIGSGIIRGCTQDLSANTVLGGLSGWRCHKGLFNNTVLTVAMVPLEMVQSGWTAGKIARHIETSTQHPNILRLLGWCDQTSEHSTKYLHCLVFDGCKGVTLKDRDRIKSWEDRLTVVGSVSSALHHLSLVFPNGGEGYLRSTDIITEQGGVAKLSGPSLSPLIQGVTAGWGNGVKPEPDETPQTPLPCTPEAEDSGTFLPSILKQPILGAAVLVPTSDHFWYVRSLGLIILEVIVAHPVDLSKDRELLHEFLTCDEVNCDKFFTKVHGPVPPLVMQKLFSIAVRCIKGRGNIAQANDRCSRLRQRYAKRAVEPRSGQ
eukprot:TRINITY_DN120_c2_g1_i1.p1 TRINITY_DN120_c2_g1~~TRINITY_DN120_c2_g1_i1.p1  ORF type:complete len:427 (+),score=44.82 TRINITY_DN120_c2_g1_i1:83-1282(+)